MINKYVFGLMVSAIVGLAVPAFAQENPAPASDSMSQAGEAMKQAGSNTADAAKDAATGTATAMRDTKITAKVKYALTSKGLTRDSDIHVQTTAGVVTLDGTVPSSSVESQAEQIALQTEGVQGVHNQLKVGQVE
jgi:osmotically-inducible protein OsmY